MKKGMEYFPLDVDFFEDEKIQFVSSRFGIKGEIFTIRLLTRIYRNGYFTKWDEDAAYLFSKVAGKEFTPGLANSIVHELVKRGFFDKTLFDSLGILTSHGIQRRFFKACERRKSVTVEKQYLLVDPSDFKNLKMGMSSLSSHLNGKCEHDVNINAKNVDINSKNVNISKQSKVEQSRVEQSSSSNSDDGDLAKLVKNYQDNIHPVSGHIEKEKLIDMLDVYGLDIAMKAIERAVLRGHRNLGYIEGILKRWQENGYDGPDKQEPAADKETQYDSIPF